MGRPKLKSVALLLTLATLTPPASAQALPMSQVIQIEEFSDTSGVSWPAITFKSQDPRNALRHFKNGAWVKFDDVNFIEGEYDSLSLNYWSSWPQDLTNATISFRLDSPTGPAVATFTNFSGTGAYGYQPSTPRVTTLTKVTGRHTLYITISGGSDICDLDFFTLIGHATLNADQAQTYFVDAANGSDDKNDGLSTGTAFRTIQKAASMMKPGSTCKIRQGVYRETVRPAYGGVSGAPLTFEPYASEQVFISGADPVTGWTKYTGNIYKATMSWSLGKYFDQVLVDGKMAWVARTPNVEESYKPHPWLAWCGGAAGPQDASAWRGIADPLSIATKVCFGDNGTHTRIDGNFPPFDMDVSTNSGETSSGAYQLPASLFNRPSDFFKGGLISLHNYYWSTVGEITGSSSPGATRTIINTNAWNSVVTDDGGPGWISHIFGLLDSPNEWFRDEKNGTLYLWAPGSDDPSTHLIEAKRRTLGLDLRGKQNVIVKGINFLATSATLADARDCVLDGCHFKYVSHADVFDWYETGSGYYNSPYDPTTGYAGVYISGRNNVFKNGSVGVSARSGIILSGRDNTVTNSHIHDCNYTVNYNAGILVMKRYVQDNLDAYHLTISHNTFAFCGRGNVQIAGASDPQTPADRNRIIYNDFGPAAFTTTETGSLACQGSQGAEVAYNWFHGTAGLSTGDIVMEYDFGARHYIVHHNVFWQGKTIVQGFKTGFHWTFDWSDTGSSASTPNAGGAMCFNNTVVDSSDLTHRDWDMNWPGFKRNNIMAMSDTAPWGFTNPVNRDYSLRAGSKAIDQGVVIPGWVESYQGKAPDLGAYESGEPRWVAGADWQEQTWAYPPSGVIAQMINAATFARPMPLMRVQHGAILIAEGSGRPYRVQLFDARGALTRSVRASKGGDLRVETGTLARGSYILRLTAGGFSDARKVMIR